MYKSQVDALATIWAKEGLSGFYRGWLANTLKVVPQNSIRCALYTATAHMLASSATAWLHKPALSSTGLPCGPPHVGLSPMRLSRDCLASRRAKQTLEARHKIILDPELCAANNSQSFDTHVLECIHQYSLTSLRMVTP